MFSLTYELLEIDKIKTLKQIKIICSLIAFLRDFLILFTLTTSFSKSPNSFNLSNIIPVVVMFIARSVVIIITISFFKKSIKKLLFIRKQKRLTINDMTRNTQIF